MVQGVGCGAQGAGCRVYFTGYNVEGVGCGEQGSESRGARSPGAPRAPRDPGTEIRDSTAYTLNPAHYIPQPCTMHPTPYTPHPSPYTLNSTPYTIPGARRATSQACGTRSPSRTRCTPTAGPPRRTSTPGEHGAVGFVGEGGGGESARETEGWRGREQATSPHVQHKQWLRERGGTR